MTSPGRKDYLGTLDLQRISQGKLLILPLSLASTMDPENASVQADEIEALSSIYSDDWAVEDEESRRYVISIMKKPRIILGVRLPDDYPASSPPYFHLDAAEIHTNDKEIIKEKLNELYLENIGEPVIYVWVECVREYVTGLRLSFQPTEQPVQQNQNQQSSPPVQTAPVVPSHEHSRNPECPEIQHGEPETERKSTFQAHVARVTSVHQVKLVMDELLSNRRIAEATHNIQAYRIELTNGSISEDCNDDGETHAARRVLYLLNIIDVRNVIVVVTRWFGGVLLGPDRFKLINNSARGALEQFGYINSNKGKEKKKKSKHR